MTSSSYRGGGDHTARRAARPRDARLRLADRPDRMVARATRGKRSRVRWRAVKRRGPRRCAQRSLWREMKREDRWRLYNSALFSSDVQGADHGLSRRPRPRGSQTARTRGHQVVLHARNEARAQQALAGVPGATAALPGDLSSITSTRALADLITPPASSTRSSTTQVSATASPPGARPRTASSTSFKSTSWRPTC